MEKFILRGYSSDQEGVGGRKFGLNLPQAKTFKLVAVKNCETTTYPEKLILSAVMRRKTRMRQHEKSHIMPIVLVDNDVLNLPKTLQQILSSHPFPLSQGPIILPLDTNTEPRKLSPKLLKPKLSSAIVAPRLVAAGFPWSLVLLHGVINLTREILRLLLLI